MSLVKIIVFLMRLTDRDAADAELESLVRVWTGDLIDSSSNPIGHNDALSLVALITHVSLVIVITWRKYNI